MRELQAGLWHWQAPHPDWTPSEPWCPEVSSYAIDDGVRLLLFDPLAVPSEILELAADREPVVAARAAGRGRAPCAWITDRPRSPRARALLTPIWIASPAPASGNDATPFGS